MPPRAAATRVSKATGRSTLESPRRRWERRREEVVWACRGGGRSSLAGERCGSIPRSPRFSGAAWWRSWWGAAGTQRALERGTWGRAIRSWRDQYRGWAGHEGRRGNDLARDHGRAEHLLQGGGPPSPPPNQRSARGGRPESAAGDRL